MASFFSLSEDLFLQLILFLFLISFSQTYGIQHPLCHAGDRSSLLQFKQSFVFDKYYCDPSTDYSKLSSWNVSEDCCSWDGVHCDNQTGHVIGLNLSSSCLFGSINSSSPLFRLVHLTSLDLSYNNFNLSRIPGGIRSLSQLRYLDLTSSEFSGQIPSEVLELSNLVFLILYDNPLMLQKPSLKDVTETLTNLKKLSLSFVNISSHVPESLSNMTSLMSLDLMNCSLQGEFPPAIFQLPNLRDLILYNNRDLIGYLPKFQVGSPLEWLWISYTNFRGQLPLSIGNLKSLRVFSASRCGLGEKIPSSIGNLTKLENLDLSVNYFKGNIPPSLGNLLQLTSLPLSYNNFSSGTLPDWLHKLTNLQYLHLIETNSYGPIPDSFQNLTQLQVLSLNDNQLSGQILSWIFTWTKLDTLYLKVNKLEGPLPIPPPSIALYDVSQNKFSGEISPLFCNLTSLLVLDLSDNNLSGNFPPCLANLGTSASALNLGKNKLSGIIPDNFTSSCALKVLDFNQNKIEGELPRSLVNCLNLEILNLQKNVMND